MVISYVALAVHFLVSLIVSTIIIFIVVKLLGEKEGMATAAFSALAGSLIYSAAYYFIGHTLYSSIIGGFAWLIALVALYKMGWGKALVTALIVWIFAAIVGTFLPTLTGPL